jgi:glycosyltransferase involved in cell wall biosynthesis
MLHRAGVAAERIHEIPNWAPAGLGPAPAGAIAAQRAAWGLADRFVVGYSGNLGRVHDLEPVLDLAAALRTDERIAFVFIGDGAQRPALEAAASARGLRNVHFHPAQPRERLAITLGVADVHLVTLRPGCERLVYPSKLAGIAGAHRPALFIGPHSCEVARTVTSAGFGLAFTREQTAEAALALRALRTDPAGLASLAAAAGRFAQDLRPDAAVARWHTLLTTQLADPPAGT